MPEAFRISNSKAACFRRCPKQYEFRYVHKLKKKRRALPLYRGGWIHELLMVHFDGGDWRTKHRALTRKFKSLLVEEREEYGDLPTEIERIMLGYTAHYKGEDEHWRTLDTEIDATVELPNGDMFNFIIDKIAEEDDGGVWLIDYKNVSSLMDDDFMLLDAQLAKYAWAAPKIGYPNVRGVIFDELCTKAPTIPKQLQSGELEQRKNLQCDVYTYYRELRRLKLDPKNYRNMLRHLQGQSQRWFRRTRMPRDRPMVEQTIRELLWTCDDIKRAESAGHFPRTPDKSCAWMCEYLHPCIVEMQGGDIDEIARLQFTTTKREQDLEVTHARILTGGRQ
jgi:PD-(D/E)XK nuclease superfamily